MDSLIALESITFGYSPGLSVLNNMFLNLGPDDRLALTGNNGSGKSTLLRVIAGLDIPTSGKVSLFGKSMKAKNDFRTIRGDVGLLFQNSDDQLFCPSVEEELAFGPLNLGLDQDTVRERVGRTLAEIGLEGYEKRVPFELSGGEKRLVALGSILTMSPGVLLLDEPGAGLDQNARSKMLDILKDRDVAMIVISHDTEIHDTLCNCRAHLEDGALSSVSPYPPRP